MNNNFYYDNLAGLTTINVNGIFLNGTDLNLRLTSDESTISNNYSILQSEISTITTSGNGSLSAILSLNSRISTDETIINNNSSSIISLNSRITTDETNINSNNSSIISINSRITTDETNIILVSAL